MKEKCILRDTGFRGFIPSRSEFVSVQIWTNKRDETGMKLKHQMSSAAEGGGWGWGIFDHRAASWRSSACVQDAGGVVWNYSRAAT